MSAEEVIKLLDGFAGFAALVNGLVLWPVVKALKRDQSELRDMVKKLIPKKTRRPKTRPRRKAL